MRGAPFLGSILVRGVWCADFGADFGARCAFLGSFLVCGAPFLGSILVHGVWCADLGADFVARCAFLGSILARCLFGIDFGAWCADVGVDHSQRATRSIQIGEDLGGNRARDLSNMGPWSWRMIPFWVDFGARCVFGLGFGVRCAVFEVDFGARCAVFGLDFGARCVVRRFWGRFRCTVRRFWARFWCAVRRFWARFWCAVCGAPIFGPIRCAFLGSQDWRAPGGNRARDLSNIGPWSWCAVRRF